MSPTTPVPHDIPLPMPAPEPLLVAVLIVFFLMHIVFVNLMVGGALMSLYYELRGLKEKRYDRLAYEIAATITANKSIAVVLGVGPLLAINTLYTVYFYTANALTGAFWIAIVPLVIVAFVLTYVHKYLWHQMERVRWLHIAVAAAACLLFLFIPLIFLTNVNLMLFPDKWGSVQGFFSALALPNVLPRYAHFILACPAMTGLLLVWLFRRRPEAEIAEMGFSRAELVRLGYRWAFWPTMAQFIVGPIAFFTLPHVASPIGGVIAAFGLSFLLAFALCVVMIREIRGPDGSIGRRFGTTCALMLAVVALMGVGRHLYREAAVAPHRAQVEAKTKDYIRRADEARRAAQARDGAPASVRP
ncbi:cytochrome C [Xanthobacter tagetidis]|uniref:Cytochrome C n=1 Tax=Xanthobacter tagetidis TaxID=60216 RepID=A0A3L7AHM4_9HYPH|nr:cytochrome C [Xanthobacter tagetidis]MBB6306952.1 cytochrome c [Xanthobacter tagetidis]RLP79986.1 cytochrome C [Xanthobacter tagetidis]